MSATTDIVQTWRTPRAVYRRLFAMGQREDRAIAYLMAACLLIFVAQWPRLVRASQGVGQATGAETPPLDRLIAYELLGWLIVWPLGMYVIAAVSAAVLWVLRRKITAYGGRLALFWALLAATPAMLFYGLLRGLNGDVAPTQIAGVLWIAALVIFWVQGLRVAVEERAAFR